MIRQLYGRQQSVPAMPTGKTAAKAVDRLSLRTQTLVTLRKLQTATNLSEHRNSGRVT